MTELLHLGNLQAVNQIQKPQNLFFQTSENQTIKQFHLFEEENPKHLKLMEVMDAYYKKTGERKIRLGNQDLQKTWKMKQDHLSKKYTTDIHHILEIPCR